MKANMNKSAKKSALVQKPSGLRKTNGDTIPKRAQRVKYVLDMQLGYGGIKDIPKITIEKNMIIFGDMKEEVLMFRFGTSYLSPLDGKIKYISKRASRKEKEHVLTQFALGAEMYSDLEFINSIRISSELGVVICHGWQKKNMEDLFLSSNKYMRETKYPNADGIPVPTYTLSANTRRYLRLQFLKENIEGSFVVLGGSTG